MLLWARISFAFIWTAVSLSASSEVPQKAPPSLLHTARSTSGDLEISGELAGLPLGTVRYVRYEDLLTLPQESYTISDDTNFKGKTEISGVALTTLARLFGQTAHSDLIVAICYDKYRSNYPSEYLVAHHPILVLKIDGKLRNAWPPSEHNTSMGPYLISHPTFKPSFSVLSHKDEAQVPFGVTRLEFRTQSVVYGAIEPPGKWEESSTVWQGYRIAREDCYRCHRMKGEGGELAGRSWLTLSGVAVANPKRFQLYIRKPLALKKDTRMPAHTAYDDATLAALTAYFQTFSRPRITP